MTKNHQEIELNPYYIKEGMKRGYKRIYRIHSIQYASHIASHIFHIGPKVHEKTMVGRLWTNRKFFAKRNSGQFETYERIFYILNRTQRTTQNLFLKSKCQNDGKMFSFGFII